MKTILCYGDSNVRGVTPEPLDERTGLTKRHIKSKRWTGLLQIKLGEKYDVVEEGMGGRTTMFDEIIPGRLYRNGLTQLPVCLESHYPIDLVIFMLGTNDVKIQFNVSANEITHGMYQLVKMVKECDKGPLGSAPKILIISPAPIIEIPNLFPQFNENSIKKSGELASLYQELAKKEGCHFLDASLFITSSELDGFHLDESQSLLLASAIAEKVMQILLN
jgi:lysophospholipase L1-like esterase